MDDDQIRWPEAAEDLVGRRPAGRRRPAPDRPGRRLDIHVDVSNLLEERRLNLRLVRWSFAAHYYTTAAPKAGTAPRQQHGLPARHHEGVRG